MVGFLCALVMRKHVICDVKHNVSAVRCNASDENHRWDALPVGNWNEVNTRFLAGWPVFEKHNQKNVAKIHSLNS